MSAHLREPLALIRGWLGRPWRLAATASPRPMIPSGAGGGWNVAVDVPVARGVVALGRETTGTRERSPSDSGHSRHPVPHHCSHHAG